MAGPRSRLAQGIEIVYGFAMACISAKEFIMALPDDWPDQHVREHCAMLRECETFEGAVAISIAMVKYVDLDALAEDTWREMGEADVHLFYHDYADRPNRRRVQAAP